MTPPPAGSPSPARPSRSAGSARTTRSAPDPGAPLTLTARDAVDLLAVTPVVLGFWPEDSIVMLTLGARRPFHGRIDLPPADDQTPEVRHLLVTRLLEPARRHGARAVVLLYFTAEPGAADLAHRSLRRALARSRLALVTAVHADGTHYRELTHPDPARRRARLPYDLADHPFVRDAVATGRLMHPTRDAMVDSIEPRGPAVVAVASALIAGRYADAGLPTTGRAVRDAGRWAHATVAAVVAALVAGDETTLDDAALARLLWVMQAPRVRDAAWSHLTAANAGAHVRLWSDALRRAPEPLAAAPAALLGWAAWQHGDGALAWAALDRCRRVDPGYRLAAHLALLLEHAVAPDQWRAPGDAVDWADWVDWSAPPADTR